MQGEFFDNIGVGHIFFSKKVTSHFFVRKNVKGSTSFFYHNVIKRMLAVEERGKFADPGHFSQKNAGWLQYIAHSGLIFFLSLRLRAGVQVNIDSLATWIPGQARNDRKREKRPEWQEERKKAGMTGRKWGWYDRRRKTLWHDRREKKCRAVTGRGKRCGMTGKN